MIIVRDFIDIHCHILPGLDDGPKDIEGSLQLARCYEELGVKKVVATPHFLPGTAWSATKEKVVQSVEELQNILDQKGILLQVESGMEIAFHKKLGDRIEAGELLPLGESNYYLVEPDFHGDQNEMFEVLDSLLKIGIFIILAHPERVAEFQKKSDLLEKLAQQGMLIQVNSGSFLGHFGSGARTTAQKIAERGFCHIIASDAHSHDSRTPINKEDWQALSEMKLGEKILESCKENLQNIFRV
ncbi:tyrosine-protein phosphatase [Desulforhopalus sp. 52FAK]